MKWIGNFLGQRIGGDIKNLSEKIFLMSLPNLDDQRNWKGAVSVFVSNKIALGCIFLNGRCFN